MFLATRRAFSLIESAIVLGIIGLIVGGIWIGASIINNKRRMNDTLDGIGLVVSNSKRLFSDRMLPSGASYNVLTHPNVTAMLLEGSNGWIVPAADDYPSTPLLSSDSSALKMRLDISGLTQRINMTFTDVSLEDCINLISRVSARHAKDLYQIQLISDSFTTFPVVPTAAQCGGSTGAPLLRFWFNL